ncbi:MAG: hydroxymyristoyl-ACP dehydratase [Bacteroidota bacterium]
MKSGLNILDLIPQRPPMVMVGEVLEATEAKIISSFTISHENVLCECDVFSEAGIIENIAQTAAAGVGLSLNETDENAEPPIGFIGALKNVMIYSLPKVNTSIRTEVTLLHRIMDASVIEGKVFQEANLIAQCEMKIFLKPKQN